MHHFPFHIGDYLAATSHLSNDEDLAFRRILDMYYHTELPIPLDTKWVAKRLRVSVESIESVLQDLFAKRDDGYHHKRCDEEIEKYQSFTVSGRKGAAVRWGKEKGREAIGGASGEDGEPIGSLPNPNSNREPRTENREPITENLKPGTSKTIVAKRDCIRPETVSEQVWQDFQTLRRAKKAPLTSSALSKIDKEAGKAGILLEAALIECCARGWTGFKADWMKTEPFSVGASTRKILERELEKEARFINPWDVKEIQ